MISFKRYTTFAFFASLQVVLGGCRTIDAPADYSRVWSPSSIESLRYSKENDLTWKNIRGQKFDNTKRLTVIDLADIALSNNPSTRQAWETARASSAAEKASESGYYPNAKIAANLDRQKTNASRKVYDLDQTDFNPALQITYLLLDFGGRNAVVEQAYENLAYANYQFNQTMQDLLLSVGTSYYDLYSAEANLLAVEADVENAKTMVVSARERLAVGLGTKLDYLQAKSNYYDVLFSKEDARGKIKTAQGNLAQIIGFPADIDVKIKQPAKEIPTYIKREDVSNMIEEALEKRPDVSSYRALLKSKEFAVTVANSNLYPTVNLGGSVSGNWYRLYDSEKKNEDDNEYTVYLNVTWDAFSGFYDYYSKKKAEAERNAQEDYLTQVELAASADVWNKFYNFRTATRKYRYSKAYYKTSMSSYDLALQSYNTGLKSMLDLLQAQSDLSSARGKLVQTKRDLFVALLDLAHAMGMLSSDRIKQE